MKNKGVKIALIIILAILIIALVNFMIYAIINRNNDYSVKFSLIAFGDNTEKIFEKEYEPEELDKINVDVLSSNVIIEKADVDKIKVTAYGEKDEKINETINNNELSITKSKTKVFIFAMFYWCDEKIIIQVPNDCEQEFNIHTSSGDIAAPNLENNVINFETSSGKIECGNINNGNFKSSSGDITVGSGNEITIQTSSGSIKAGDFNKLSAEASSGDVEVGKVGESTIKTSSGKILIESAKRLQAEASSGEIDINTIEEYCNLVTSSGSIEIDSLNITENSNINAKSGDVDIISKNDIYIETETGSGDADVTNNNRMSEIVLKITTTSGSIKVD
mgnify:FL=1